MKRMLILWILMLLFGTSVVNAAWEPTNVIEGNKQVYIDSSTIKSYTEAPYDFVKCQVRIDQNNGDYTVYLMLINKDTKDWTTPVVYVYKMNNKLRDRWTYDKNLWSRYDQGNLQITIDKILEKAEGQR